MNNTILQLKIKERLNKLDSQDYDNLTCWQMVEAFNKAQVEWCRRQLHGQNIFKEGDEQSTRRIDDLQVLLLGAALGGTTKKLFHEANIPNDYLQWKRVSAQATDDCCETPRRMVIYLAEEGNLDILLRDKEKQPSFEWAETFATMKDGKIFIHTDGKFTISSPSLVYYRQPVRIQITGCTDPFTNTVPLVDVESEFKDDIVELMIDEAVSVLAGDIESMNQYAREQQNTEKNN